MAKYNTKAEAEQQLQQVLRKFPKTFSRLSQDAHKKPSNYIRDEMFYLLTNRDVDNNMAMIVADNWARGFGDLRKPFNTESTLHGLDNLIEGVNDEFLSTDAGIVKFLKGKGASKYYINYVLRFPNSSSAAGWIRHWKDGFMDFGGGFGTALFDGDIEDAYFRADGQNRANLQKMGIKFSRGEAGVKKKEYDWTVDPDLFDEEEESGTSKGAKKGWSTRNKYQKRRDKWDNDPDYAEKMMRTGYYDKDESIKETLESLDNLIERKMGWVVFKKDGQTYEFHDQKREAIKQADRIGGYVQKEVTKGGDLGDVVYDARDGKGLYDREVLQSASGSLSPQRRNKAIRALQSIPRDQTLGKSDVFPNVDTALELSKTGEKVLKDAGVQNGMLSEMIREIQKAIRRQGSHSVLRRDLKELQEELRDEELEAEWDDDPKKYNKKYRIKEVLYGMDNLIGAKELKQQIGEALVQIKEALRPMPDAGRSGYNKFGHQGFRKEWSELIKVYEDLLLKCQNSSPNYTGGGLGTRPANLKTEQDFKDRLKFIEIELRKCKQAM